MHAFGEWEWGHTGNAMKNEFATIFNLFLISILAMQGFPQDGDLSNVNTKSHKVCHSES